MICSANQLTGFYMMGTLAVKGIIYLPEGSDYVNQNHDVTNTEIENILRERGVVAEGEFETNRYDAELEEFFSYVVQNEGLCYPPQLERSRKKF